MDKRLIDFIAGLRAAGVRISIAESEDAFLAARHMGIRDKDDFQNSLRATLVKEAADQPVFDQLFPLYFGSGGPPLQDLMEDLTQEEKDLLAQALRALLEQMRRQQQDGTPQQGRQSGQQQSSQLDSLMQLLQMLLQGQNMDQQQQDQIKSAGAGGQPLPAPLAGTADLPPARHATAGAVDGAARTNAQRVGHEPRGHQRVDGGHWRPIEKRWLDKLPKRLARLSLSSRPRSKPNKNKEAGDLMDPTFPQLDRARSGSFARSSAAAGHPTA